LISVQFLAFFSAFLDVVKRRPTPTPLGTHHFALIMVAWGPVLAFSASLLSSLYVQRQLMSSHAMFGPLGHFPAVRRNLIPWRPVS
ncbi:hypothetical protein GALMADRAFT_73860, partial [Galerina marginata CBS 339.88]